MLWLCWLNWYCKLFELCRCFEEYNFLLKIQDKISCLKWVCLICQFPQSVAWGGRVATCLSDHCKTRSVFVEHCFCNSFLEIRTHFDIEMTKMPWFTWTHQLHLPLKKSVFSLLCPPTLLEFTPSSSLYPYFFCLSPAVGCWKDFTIEKADSHSSVLPCLPQGF